MYPQFSFACSFTGSGTNFKKILQSLPFAYTASLEGMEEVIDAAEQEVMCKVFFQGALSRNRAPGGEIPVPQAAVFLYIIRRGLL